MNIFKTTHWYFYIKDIDNFNNISKNIPENTFLNLINISPENTKVVFIFGKPTMDNGQLLVLSNSAVKNLKQEVFNTYNKKSLDIWEGVLIINVSLIYDDDLNVLNKWYKITNNIICEFSNEFKNVVFSLFGYEASLLEHLISKDNLILKYSHPSNFTFSNGQNPLEYSNIFKIINDYLTSNKKKNIQWFN